MLFTGDMDEVIEKEIADKMAGSIEVLKVAHHGSATSSGEEVSDNPPHQTAGKTALFYLSRYLD